MTEDDEGRREARRCRVEELEPGVDWDRSFTFSRMKGLSPNDKSTLFKLLHQLLPTGERVHRLQPNKSAACSLCREAPVDTLHHAIFTCQANQLAAEVMLRCAQCYSKWSSTSRGGGARSIFSSHCGYYCNLCTAFMEKQDKISDD